MYPCKKKDFEPDTIIYVFIDGIGLGAPCRESNPFARYRSHFFSVLGGKSSFPAPGDIIPTDPHMGVWDTPQSATGQTALFTGVNGPKILKRHVTGFPTYTLRPVFKEKSIIKRFVESGKKATLLNSYTDGYLDKIRSRRGQRFMSASSLTQAASGLPFFTMKDYLEGRSLYMDITNWFLKSSGMDISITSPVKTGRKLVSLSKNYDLVLYEYFFTDVIGHEADMRSARRILNHIEGLLEGVWEEMNPEKELFILSSDHGNFEDLSHTHHTNHLVPTIVYGKSSDILKKRIKFLFDIPNAIASLKNIKT